MTSTNTRSLRAAAAVICSAALLPIPTAAQTREAAHARAGAPSMFVQNAGQRHAAVRFTWRDDQSTVFFTETGFVLQWSGPPRVSGTTQPIGLAGRPWAPPALGGVREAQNLFVTFADGRPVAPIGLERSHARVAVYRGSDPQRWVHDAPAYEGLLYRDVYPGIDIRVKTVGGRLEYDVIAGPGADLGAFALRIEGADGHAVDVQGSLISRTALGELTQVIPAAWHESAHGDREPVDATFVLRADGSAGLAVSERDLSRRLVVDPGLILASYLAGSANEIALALAVDATGASYVSGYALSTDFPSVPGTTVILGGQDAFATSFTAAGDALVYSVVFGGTDGNVSDFCYDNALALDGSLLLCGETTATDFPVTGGAYDTSANGGSDGWLAKLAPDGSLTWATYLGGPTFGDAANGIAVNAAGDVATCGVTAATGFPVTAGAHDTTHGGFTDGFVARLSADGSSLVWATFVGGNMIDDLFEVAFDDSGVCAAGNTGSTSGYPTTAGAFDVSFNGGTDAVLTKLSADGSALAFSTFLGSSGSTEAAHALVREPCTGDWLVAGQTNSAGFPTTIGAFDESYNGGAADGFVSRLAADGSALVWSTLIGGGAADGCFDIAVDHLGRPAVTGQTLSAGFPVTSLAFDTTPGGTSDAFVVHLGLLGSIVSYASRIGGSGSEVGWGIGLDAATHSHVAGFTNSSDFPATSGAFSTSPGGGNDAFLVEVQSVWVDVGNELPGNTSPKNIADGALTGGDALALRLRDAPPGVTACLVFGVAQLGAAFKGGVLVPDPNPPGGVTCFLTSGSGAIDLVTLWPAGIPSSIDLVLQWWVPDAGGPSGYAATAGLVGTTP